MFSLLLAIIYASFISLGLPDSLLGSAWPSMYTGLGVPISYAGIVSMIVAGGTIISSLFSDRLIRKLGTGPVTAISVGLTAAALFGFSVSGSFVALCILALPYGLGAGCVDAALNNYVAVNYESRHMNWLHCFWGVGAMISPYIMGICLTRGTWSDGYRTISFIQLALTAMLIFSLPLWKKKQSAQPVSIKKSKALKFVELLKIPGVKPVLLAFFGYCALEATAGMWASSYLVLAKGMDAKTAATWASLFYMGITAGRFISGFITAKFGNKKMVSFGQVFIVAGIVTLLLPFGNTCLLVGLLLIGTGCAPIYPALVDETPDNFGEELSQSIMGMQMACAYIGGAFMPSLFGAVVDLFSIKLYPLFLLLYTGVITISALSLNRAVDRHAAPNILSLL